MIARQHRRSTHDLRSLDRVARELAEATDLRDLKDLRDKAEAARSFAKSAALSLEIQNRAAELKLRAERRAGELLGELVRHGGNRRSSYHDGNLKLSDLGINSNQSSRWRREAAIPTSAFEQYLATAMELGQEITAQGLLRLERSLAKDREKSRPIETVLVKRENGSQKLPTAVRRGAKECLGAGQGDTAEMRSELWEEAKNHRQLLEEILKPFCRSINATLRQSEKRMVLRLLSEIERLMARLEQPERRPD